MNKLLTNRADPAFTETTELISREESSLAHKVAKLTAENHYLRRSNRVRPHLRIVLRAEESARTLALWHCSGYRTGRKAAFLNGMSNTSFFTGRALLELAGVHNGRAWTIDNPDLIERKIANAADYAKRSPAALIANMPPSKQPKVSLT